VWRNRSGGKHVHTNYPGWHDDLGRYQYSSTGGTDPGSGSGDSGGDTTTDPTKQGEGDLTVFDGENFVVPSAIRAWNGSEWVDVDVSIFANGTWQAVYQNVDVTFIEAFDSDLSRWGQVPSTFTVDGNTPVNQGSKSLKYDGLLSGDSIISLPGDGLDNYPVAGDSFSFDWYVTSTDNRVKFTFGTQAYSMNHGYTVELDPRGDDFKIIREDPGASLATNKLAQSTLDLSAYVNSWVTVRVDWGTDGVIVVTLLDDQSNTIRTLDNTAEPNTDFTSGGIGIQANDTNPMSFDNMRLL
jgi:hypothetical protein